MDIMEDDSAKKLWRLMRKRRIREFSFAYDIVEEERADDGANDLKVLDIIEVGPTLKGANPATELIAVKNDPAPVEQPSSDTMVTANATFTVDAKTNTVTNATWDNVNITTNGTTDAVKWFPLPNITDLKVGRVLSAKNEADIRKAAELLQGVLAKLDRDNADGKSDPNPEDRSGVSPDDNGEDGPPMTPLRLLIEAELAQGF